MPKRVHYGPRLKTINYTVKVRGEHGCMVASNPASVVAQVACYLESRPGGVCDVTYSEHCADCAGAGRVCANRRTLAWKPCKACGGEPELLSYTFSPDELRTLMRRWQSAYLAA